MTCIIAIKDKSSNKIYLGGDSCGFNNSQSTKRKDKKIFRRGSYAIGFTSSYRMGQLLQYYGELPEPDDTKDLHEFMVTDFIDAVRKIFSTAGFITKKDSEETGGNFIVVVQGRIFEVQSDFQVEEPLANYHSTGCGKLYALGAMHALYDRLPAKECIEIALSVAEDLNPFVGSPFNIIEVSSED